MNPIPGRADSLILGGGTAGAVIANRLAAQGGSVVVLEAGPDYGPLAGGRWPVDLLDAVTIPDSHDWGYTSGGTFAGRELVFERARVVGGCSTHFGCALVYGHRLDYDAWAKAGNAGWSTDELLPLLEAGERAYRGRTFQPDEFTPFQRLFYDAAPQIGLPQLATTNGIDETVGAAPETVNSVDGLRFNAAFAYLDPVRDLPNLQVVGECLVDRLILKGDRAVAVEYVHAGRRSVIEAGQIVICAGSYGTPLILQRSGIGDPEHLAAAGVEVTIEHPYVGANLHDQPLVTVEYEGSELLEAEWRAFAADHLAPDEQLMIKARSHSAGDEPAFDLHLLPWSPPIAGGRHRWLMDSTCLTPRARGEITITAADPEAQPRIDHRFLDDPTGHDLAVIVDGIEIIRSLAAQTAAAERLGAEIGPSSRARSRAEIGEWVRGVVQHYWHPVGTCKMGPDSDPAAVVDADGRLRGVENVVVADCSIMPTIPRTTTALTAVVVAERIAQPLIHAKGV